MVMNNNKNFSASNCLTGREPRMWNPLYLIGLHMDICSHPYLQVIKADAKIYTMQTFAMTQI